MKRKSTIKNPIDSLRQEVSKGSSLVQQAGQVFVAISSKITTVSERVEVIASASRNQLVALAGVNSAVANVDQMTQQNAAMVEETNLATRKLAIEATGLLSLVQTFQLTLLVTSSNAAAA